MALTNFSLPFGAITTSIQHWGATVSPLHPIHQLATNTNNLLYGPADHQQQIDDGEAPVPESNFYKNNPYAPPQYHPQSAQRPPYQYNNNNNNGNGGRRKGGNAYLPPIPSPQFHHQQIQFSHLGTQEQQQQQQQPQINTNSISYKEATATRTYDEGTYNNQFPTVTSTQQQQLSSGGQKQLAQQPKQRFNAFSATQTRISAGSYNTAQQPSKNGQNFGSKIETPVATYGAAPPTVLSPPAADTPTNSDSNNYNNNSNNNGNNNQEDPDYPERPPGFTRVQAGQGSRTQVHAVLDYDDEEEEDEYYDENTKKSSMPTVTPIQGPIFLKNNSVPVVPLFSYPTLNNGTFVQIPIWWTALSVALGLDVSGDIIKGVPCIKKYHQLFCPTAGNSYPIDKIERFIDDNKALMRRMYGDFEMNMVPDGPRQQTKRRKRRYIDEPDIFIPPGAFPAVPTDVEVEPHAEEAGESYFGKLRNKRQANQNRNSNRKPNGSINPGQAGSSTGRLDACESKVEIVTPYWASNSAGKIRAIVNTQHFEQAIHQEICSKTQTPRCTKDCGCEQKYKWHRLLAYDPDNDCKGIFMDWFLFPSCCVCRCNP